MLNKQLGMNFFSDTCNIQVADTEFGKNMNFDNKNYTICVDGNTFALFPDKSNKLALRAIDWYIMIGHHLYSQNEQFREAYLKAFDGKEFSINYKDARVLITSRLFNAMLYGIVVPAFVRKMPDIPLHYLCRPKEDEANKSRALWVDSERAKGRRPGLSVKEGSPYYNYMEKRSARICPSGNVQVANPGDMCICPVKNLVPYLKDFAESMKKFGDSIYKTAIVSKDYTIQSMLSYFTDSSWSPLLSSL